MLSGGQTRIVPDAWSLRMSLRMTLRMTSRSRGPCTRRCVAVGALAGRTSYLDGAAVCGAGIGFRTTNRTSWSIASQMLSKERIRRRTCPRIRTGCSSQVTLDVKAVAPDPAGSSSDGRGLSARLRLAICSGGRRGCSIGKCGIRGRDDAVVSTVVGREPRFILLPNIAAGFFNFLYNDVEIIQRQSELRPRFH